MPVVIPDGLEEAWLEPADGPALRALEPLMAPWDPAAWQALKLERMPGDEGRRRPLAGPAAGEVDLAQLQLDLLKRPPGPSIHG
jgi:hypothetical protein